MLQLKPKQTDGRAQWLVEKSYGFGAAHDNHFHINNKHIQANHAVIEIDGDVLTLRNLIGDDAVKVNGAVVKQGVVLKAEDEICIGETFFTLEDPKKNRAPVATPSFDASEQTAQWSLKAQNTALANKVFALEGSKIIGRSSECDICLKVVHLSRKHARLTLKGDYIEIEDLKSSNGTYLNGNKVESANAKSGDEIAFDTLRFTLIGPQDLLSATQIRPAVDADATSMRPALSAEQLAQMKPKHPIPPKKVHSAAPQAHLEKAPTEVVKTIDDNDSKAGILAFVITAVIIALVLSAYLYLA